MQKHFTRLGLGGGGIKGILHVGALQELAKYQKLEFPNGVYGCSIGSIIGTYLAFGLPIDKLSDLTKKHLSTKNFTPSIGLYDITSCLSKKGLFSMNQFEKTVCSVFDEAGLDIRKKVIGDANMPLFIIASNVTKGKPTIFSKDVPLLEAIKCSCCIPGVFKPQVLYNQVYVDGDFFSPNIGVIVPISDDTIILTLPRRRTIVITAETIDSVSPFDFAYDLISIATRQSGLHKNNPCTLPLMYPMLTSSSDLEKMDIIDIFKYASSKLRRFLLTKNLC
jgi:predicted patatin/cPLA2 family phospholipase